MQQIIAVTNQKGGVGKTTLTRELGIYLSKTGCSVLLIDADPQANLSRSLIDDASGGLYTALLSQRYSIYEITPALHLLSGSIDLASLEKQLIGELDAYTRLKDLLSAERFEGYEYMFIDCPPSLGVLTVNALTAATDFLVPMNPSVYSMQGTNDLMATVSKIRKNLNPTLNLLGVVINAFDSIPTITRQIRDEIEQGFQDKLFRTMLSKSIKIEEAIASRKGVVDIPKAKAKQEVEQIGSELIERLAYRV